MQRLALITGASSGIGADAARELARRGFRVILVARDTARLEAVAASIGPAAVVERCDLASGDAVVAMARRLMGSVGVPDLIVNNAGAGAWARIEDTPPAEAAAMIGAPYLAAFNVTHAFMRPMLARGSGTLIHINSPASLFPWPATVGYSAARTALRGFHEALCQDLAGTGVRSCHVIFGRVDSPYFASNRGAAEHMPGIAATVRTLSTAECGRVIADVAQRPRREVIHPFMLRFYRWNYQVTPWVVRWLLRATGAKRDAGVGTGR